MNLTGSKHYLVLVIRRHPFFRKNLPENFRKLAPLNDTEPIKLEQDILAKVSNLLGFELNDVTQHVRSWMSGDTHEPNQKLRNIGLAYALWLSESKKKKYIISSRSNSISSKHYVFPSHANLSKLHLKS